MRQRRLISWALALVMILGIAGLTTTALKAEDETVTIRQFYWDTNQEPYYKEALELFHETHPEIEVTFEIAPWSDYWTKLEAAATGGSVADCFWMNGPNITLYHEGGIMEPLNDYIEGSDIDLANYPQGLVELYTVEDQTYAIPKDFDTVAVWYNKELFDKAGLDYPTAEWTWDEMMDMARAINNPDEGIWGIASINTNQSGYYNTILANGGFIISEDKKTSGYDDPKSIEGVDLWRQMMEEELSPSLAVQEDDPARVLFANGKIGMMFDGSWRVPEFLHNDEIKDKIDVAEVPSINGQKASVIHGLGLVMSSFSEQKDAVWTWIDFLASKEANDLQATTGAAIPAHKDSTSLWAESFPEHNLDAYIQAAENFSYPYPVSANTAAWNQYEIDYMKQILNLELTSEEGCKQLAEKMNESLAQE